MKERKRTEMDEFNENTEEKQVRYGDPDYRDAADYGRSAKAGSPGEAYRKELRRSFDELKTGEQAPEGDSGLFVPLHEESRTDTRRRVVTGVLLAAATVLLAVILISGVMRIMGVGEKKNAAAPGKKRPADEAASLHPLSRCPARGV